MENRGKISAHLQLLHLANPTKHTAPEQWLLICRSLFPSSNLSDQACSVISLQVSVDTQINKQLKSNYVLICLRKLKGLTTLSAYCLQHGSIHINYNAK